MEGWRIKRTQVSYAAVRLGVSRHTFEQGARDAEVLRMQFLAEPPLFSDTAAREEGELEGEKKGIKVKYYYC